MLRVREEAIVDAVNQLLIDKGYDQMTVDQVAAAVGIAKASLYKHFPSKEALAAAAMVRTLRQAQDQLDALAATPQSALQRLRGALRWIMQMQFDGAMPTLPSENSTLRSVLMADKAYGELLMAVSETLGAWIVQAQEAGDLDRRLPAEVVLLTLYARACDPVLPLLKATGLHARGDILEWLESSFFEGVGRPRSPGHLI